MDPQKDKSDKLPPFRKDLRMFQGPDELDGSPSFCVYDPLKSQYFKISWGESQVLMNYEDGMSVQDLCDKLNAQTTLKVTSKEIRAYIEDAARHNLLALPKTGKQLSEALEKSKVNPLQWLLFHYLYIRIPLWDPERFLIKTLPYAKFFYSSSMIFIYIILSLAGVGILFSRFDEFLNTFPYFFSTQGFLAYALALTAVKVIHEMAHAYTATNYSVRVPSMGVLLLVLWPVLFTDVTDGWKLVKRKDRLMISAAGIVSECIIAGICTFGWTVTQPGIWNSIFFVIASVSWLSTLLVNANPAMRFDGYYILCDLWGIDNLQNRAFAVTRWKLRDWFFGLKAAPPEDKLSPARIRGMVVYSLYTWIYRLFLYTAIAIFVYVSFTKALGVFLFILEVGVFIVWPISSELKVLFKQRRQLVKSPRFLVLCSAICVLVAWFILPLQREERFQAITVPDVEQVIYVPHDGFVKEIFVKRGDFVKAGQPLIQLYSKELQGEIDQLSFEESIILQKLKTLALEQRHRAYIPEKLRELEAVRAKMTSLQLKRDTLRINSRLEGELFFWDQELRPGQPIAKDRIIGKLGDIKKVTVICYVPESDLGAVRAGQEVNFVNNSTLKTYSGVIERVFPTRAEKLDYPVLASLYAGNLPVARDSSNDLYLVDSYYKVRISLNHTSEEELRFGQSGVVKLDGPERSLLSTTISWMLSLFWQESSF